MHEVTLLERRVSMEGQRVDPKTIQAIRLPATTDQEAVPKIIGMANYQQEMIASFSEIIFPISQLMMNPKKGCGEK